jgi:hypothetical protein
LDIPLKSGIVEAMEVFNKVIQREQMNDLSERSRNTQRQERGVVVGGVTTDDLIASPVKIGDP